jgi:hypothetical protein
VLVAVHPELPRVSASAPRGIYVRADVAAVTTTGAFAIATVLAVVARIAGRRPVARGLWVFLLLLCMIGLFLAYQDPSGAGFLRRLAAQAP